MKSLIIPSLIICFLLLPTACMGYSDSYRYRLTVEVETPEGIKSGSAVREVIATDNTDNHSFLVGSAPTCGFEVKGEAVVIDLGERGKLFALLTRGGGSNKNAYEIVHQTFPQDRGACLKPAIQYYANLEGKAAVPLKAHPMMVAFKDINDPASVQLAYQVNAEEKHLKNDTGSTYLKTVHHAEDHLVKLFGEGVKLRGITLEMTDDNVSEAIKRELSWLSKYRGKRFDGNRYGTIKAQNRLANSLSTGVLSANIVYGD